MSAALDAAGPSAMFRRFFNSCLQKRPERSPSQPPHLEGSAETDSSDATLVPLQSTTHSPKFPTRDPITASPRERDEAQRRTPPSKSDTMPRAAKAKSTPKSAKDRKPSLRVQQATRSDSHITCCSHQIHCLLLSTHYFILTICVFADSLPRSLSQMSILWPTFRQRRPGSTGCSMSLFPVRPSQLTGLRPHENSPSMNSRACNGQEHHHR